MDPDDTQPGENNDPLAYDTDGSEKAAGTSEEFFFFGLEEWAARGVQIEQGRKCETPIGAVRLALVVSSLPGARRVAVECGRIPMSDSSVERRRDRAVVAYGQLARVYRLRAADIEESLHDVLHLLGILEPGLIDAKGMAELARLCGPEDSCKDDLAAKWHVFPYCAIRTFFDDQWSGASLKRRLGMMIWWTDAPGTAQGDHSDAEGRQGIRPHSRRPCRFPES